MVRLITAWLYDRYHEIELTPCQPPGDQIFTILPLLFAFDATAPDRVYPRHRAAKRACSRCTGYEADPVFEAAWQPVGSGESGCVAATYVAAVRQSLQRLQRDVRVDDHSRGSHRGRGVVVSKTTET